MALTVALGLGVAPIGRAWAGPPIDAAPDSDAERFSEAPPEAEAEAESGQALRIVDSESSDAAAEPADAVELVEFVEPVPAPTIDDTNELMDQPGPPMVDTKRPISGVGLITMGSLSLAASAVMAITGMAGPGWFDVDRDEARLVGLLSLPLGLAGLSMAVGGSRSHKKYRSWASRNQLTPPNIGTGMLIGGATMTVVFGLPAVLATQSLMDRQRTQIGEWMPTVMLGSLALAGVVVVAGGMHRRSKFATWERTGYVMPGTMALKGGGGVTISGRF